MRDDTLNYGLVFSPTNSNVIKGFYSYYASDTSNQPSLYINYIDTNGNSGTYKHNLSVSRYVSKFDTTNLDGNLINVQYGIAYRGLISFDDLLTSWPVQIYSAVLQITLDSTKSSTHFVPYGTPFAFNSLYALSVDENGISNGLSYATSKQSTDIPGRYIYTFDIRSLAILWLSNTTARKVALSGTYEAGSFDLFTFFGTGYDKTLRPRVIITYSLQR